MERTQRRIVIALSSSVNEFHRERVELGDFIRHLNQIIYNRRGISLDWRVCEDESRHIRHSIFQDEFDGDIRQSRFLFVLIGKRFGEFTEHEFYLALELFNASGNHPDPERRDIPKIYPFFTDVPEEEREPRAREFRRKVETEINGGQLTTPFPVKLPNTPERYAMDTLKLYLLEEFGRDPLLWGNVTVEDGQARMDGQPVMSVENVPMYANHVNLQWLKEKRDGLNQKFAELSVQYHAGNKDAGVKRILVDRERSELTEEIRKIEKETFKMFRLLEEMSKERQTERAEKAARLLSNGEYEQARAVLQSIDSPEVRADWKCGAQMTDLSLDYFHRLIQENRLRIWAMRADGITRENLPELTECYKIGSDAAQQYHIEPEAVYDYADFLREFRRDYSRAIKLCEWLEEEYHQEERRTGIKTPSETRAQLYNLLGVCHMQNGNFREGETYYRDALKRFRALAETNPETHIPNVAMTCNNLAVFLNETGRHAEAEPLCREALERYRKLAEACPDAFNQYVAKACNNLAELLRVTGRHAEAETLCREALKRYRKLADAYPDEFKQDVATSCNNLANLLKDTGRYAEAEPLYCEALERYRKLADAYPDAFNKDVADVCNNLATLYLQTYRDAEAEPLFWEALELYCALADAYPGAFNKDVAMTCNNLANLYYQTGRYGGAEPLYCEALERYRELADAYPDAFNKDVAMTCNNLATLYFQTYRDAEAEPLYREALDIRRKLAETCPDAFNQYVATTCNNLALLLSYTGRHMEAEPLYREALKLYRKLAEAYPDAFNQDVAETCFNIGSFELQRKNNPAAKKYFEEALALFERSPYRAKDAAKTRAILEQYF